jgi:hypothetical protein
LEGVYGKFYQNEFYDERDEEVEYYQDNAALFDGRNI